MPREDGFDQRVCDIRNAEQNRRIGDVESAQAALESKMDSHLERLYSKIETETLAYANKAIEMAKRPGWATVAIITFLSSLSVGLIVKSVWGN